MNLSRPFWRIFRLLNKEDLRRATVPRRPWQVSQKKLNPVSLLWLPTITILMTTGPSNNLVVVHKMLLLLYLRKPNKSKPLKERRRKAKTTKRISINSSWK